MSVSKQMKYAKRTKQKVRLKNGEGAPSVVPHTRNPTHNTPPLYPRPSHKRRKSRGQMSRTRKAMALAKRGVQASTIQVDRCPAKLPRAQSAPCSAPPGHARGLHGMVRNARKNSTLDDVKVLLCDELAKCKLMCANCKHRNDLWLPRSRTFRTIYDFYGNAL